MIERTLVTTLAAIFAFSTVAQESLPPHPYYEAEGKHEGVFLCVPELSGGIRFDEFSKRWTYGGFRTDGKSFVFKITPSRLMELEIGATRYRAMAYDMTVSRPGENRVDNCRSMTGGALLTYENGLFECTTGFLDYKLNIGPMRFMEVYSHGYIDGRDQAGNTPSISVGKCSRI